MEAKTRFCNFCGTRNQIENSECIYCQMNIDLERKTDETPLIPIEERISNLMAIATHPGKKEQGIMEFLKSIEKYPMLIDLLIIWHNTQSSIKPRPDTNYYPKFHTKSMYLMLQTKYGLTHARADTIINKFKTILEALEIDPSKDYEEHLMGEEVFRQLKDKFGKPLQKTFLKHFRSAKKREKAALFVFMELYDEIKGELDFLTIRETYELSEGITKDITNQLKSHPKWPTDFIFEESDMQLLRFYLTNHLLYVSDHQTQSKAKNFNYIFYIPPWIQELKPTIQKEMTPFVKRLSQKILGHTSSSEPSK